MHPLAYDLGAQDLIITDEIDHMILQTNIALQHVMTPHATLPCLVTCIMHPSILCSM